MALRHRCSPVNLLHIFRIPFPRNTSERQLLTFLTHILFMLYSLDYLCNHLFVSVSMFQRLLKCYVKHQLVYNFLCVQDFSSQKLGRYQQPSDYQEAFQFLTYHEQDCVKCQLRLLNLFFTLNSELIVRLAIDFSRLIS